MLSKVTGTADKRLKNLLKCATEYYCGSLMSPRLIRNISISIVLKKDLEEDGFCCIEEYNTAGKPREFVIEIDKKLNKRTMLTVLAHECVHVKQYAMGELDDGMTVWRGRRVNSDKLPYWDHPWEIEAYGKEKGLFVRFAEKQGLYSLFKEPME